MSMLIYSLATFTATDGTSCTPNTTFTLTDAAANIAIQRGQARPAQGPNSTFIAGSTVPAGLATDASGNTALVGADGARARLFGPKILTVGVSGEFTTIAAALAYVATQPAFIDITSTITLPGAVLSWAQGSSDITLVDTVTSYLPSIDTLRFKVAGDAYYYPVEGTTNSLIGSGTALLTSAIPRIDTSISAANLALTWYRENIFTLRLLDNYYAENLSNTAFTADMCVCFEGNQSTLWRGLLPVGAKNGRIDFSGVNTTGSGTTGTFMSNGTGAAANTVRVNIDYGQIAHEGDDWIYPGVYLGSLRMRYSSINDQMSNIAGNSISPRCGGDIILEECNWHINPLSATTSAANDAQLIDKAYARRVVVNGLRGYLSDKNGDLGKVSVFGEHMNAVKDSVILNDVELICKDTTGCNFSIAALNLNAPSGLEVNVSNCGISAPNGTGFQKLVKVVSTPAGAMTVKIGRGNKTLICDPNANVTYTPIRAGASGNATISAAATSVVVTHGLGYTPNIEDIVIVPTLLSSSAKWWVSSVGATTFQINVDVVPGAGTATFSWRVGS